MADDTGDRHDAGGTGVPQFAGTVLDGHPERLASLLGYGPNPYEKQATAVLVEDLVTRLGEALQLAFDPRAAKSLQAHIQAAAEATGGQTRLVLIAAFVTALMATATKIATHPPTDKDFTDINADSLRYFRAHLHDMALTGNVVQRQVLDDWRAREIERRRS
jgi:hypothetical protein